MITYQNRGGNSGVAEYNIYPDSISVRFKSGRYRYYVYTINSVGADDLWWLKLFAEYGQGLNSFINSNVKYGYQYRY